MPPGSPWWCIPILTPGPGRSGNHAIDVRVVGRFLYFLQPRLGMVGRLTIEREWRFSGPDDFGGLSPLGCGAFLQP